MAWPRSSERSRRGGGRGGDGEGGVDLEGIDGGGSTQEGALPPEAAVRIVNAIRGVSYRGLPPVWIDEVLEERMNILGWAVMVAMGANAATSVRISNELGAGHPRTAKFSILVVVITSFLIGLGLSLILVIFRKQYPSAFTSSEDVKKLVYDLTPFLATSIIVNNVQPVLSGLAIGAGWQALVAYVNIACYYIFGIPLGLILGYMLNMGVRGIWCGMIMGTVVQTIILFG